MRALIVLALLSPLSAMAGRPDPSVWTAEACNTLEAQIQESKAIIVDGMVATNSPRLIRDVIAKQKMLKINIAEIALQKEIEANDLRIAAYRQNCQPQNQRSL